MAVEYGATIGYFPVDEQTCKYLTQTGRTPERVRATEAFYRAQGCFGAAKKGEVDYSQELELDLSGIVPSVAGPKRPQDRIALDNIKSAFEAALTQPLATGGYGKETARSSQEGVDSGDVVIAAITSCTNTSNPGVMVAAGLVAKKAVELGLSVKPTVKTSLTPGSTVVSKYLDAAGLQPYLDKLGFAIAGYSSARASAPRVRSTPRSSSRSWTRTSSRALCSPATQLRSAYPPAGPRIVPREPPLVVAFALAGRVDFDSRGGARHRHQRQAGVPARRLADCRGITAGARHRRESRVLPGHLCR